MGASKPAEIIRAEPVNLRMFDDSGWERGRVAEMRGKGWSWQTVAAILGRNEQTLRSLYEPRPSSLALVASALIAPTEPMAAEAAAPAPAKPPRSQAPGCPNLRLEPNSYGARVLRIMAKGGRWSTGALASNMERDSSTISVTCGSLLRAKLIANVGTGRFGLYEITDRGRERLAETKRRAAG